MASASSGAKKSWSRFLLIPAAGTPKTRAAAVLALRKAPPSPSRKMRSRAFYTTDL
jgi:hypothetical protein